MSIEKENDLLALQKIGRIVAKCLQLMGTKLEPGITTREIDGIGKQFLEAHGVVFTHFLPVSLIGLTALGYSF